VSRRARPVEPPEWRARAALLAALQGRIPDPVLEALGAVDRRLFVPAELRDRGWENVSLPIGAEQTISQPSLVAAMVALADPGPGARVLDVGTGSGYHAAVLSRLAGRVWSVERKAALSAFAAANLAAAGIDNVELRVGDGSDGHPPAAPYEVINVAAAMRDEVPAVLLEQLADGGRLVGPVGDGDEQVLVRVVRHGSRLRRSEHGPVRFVPFVRERS